MALLPSWFSLDPNEGKTASGMGNLLSALNSEAEVSYGGRLQFSVSRRPLEAQSFMQYTLVWNFSPKVRLQMNSGTNSSPKILLEYLGEGTSVRGLSDN